MKTLKTITVIGALEAVANADHVVAAVVFVVAHEDVQRFIEGDVIDVSQAAGEDVQVGTVPAAAQNPSFV